MKKILIKIHSQDNVAVAIEDIKAGTKITDDLTAIDLIPQAHKIALKNISEGAEIRRIILLSAMQKKIFRKASGLTNI